MRASGQATAADNVKAIEEVIARLDRWGKANAKLVAQNPELRKELFRRSRASRKTWTAPSLVIPGKERLDEALKAAKAFGAEATTNAEKLPPPSRRSFLQKVQGSGQINTLETKKKLQGRSTN